MKKNLTVKTALAAAVTAIALTAGAAQANPWVYGYGYQKVDYTNSFNRSHKTDVAVDASQRIKRDYRFNYNLDNSVDTRIKKDTRLNYNYNLRKNDINASQNLNQLRAYRSSVGQNAANVGSASGHSMKQKQGGTTVGSLVSETSATRHKGHNIGSPTYSYSNGNVDKGNMFGSQIGANQSGAQFGNVANIQGNSQGQRATSAVGSVDSVKNTASK